MSSQFTTKVCDLLIPIGANAVTPVVQGDFTTQDAETITIFTPSNADPVPFHIQLAPSGTALDSDDFYDLRDENGDLVLLGAAGEAKEFHFPAWPSWRIKAGSPVSRDTVFPVFKSHRG